MMFEGWTNATLYDMNGMMYDSILINYNGDSNFLEAKKNEKEFIDVDINQIPRAVIKDVKATGVEDFAFLDSLIMVRKLNPKSRSSYFVLLHKDKDKMLLLEYVANINTATSHLPGENEVRQRFYKKYNMIFHSKGTISNFSNTKKKMAKHFDEYGDYLKWCKSKRLKPDKFEAAVKFLKAHP